LTAEEIQAGGAFSQVCSSSRVLILEKGSDSSSKSTSTTFNVATTPRCQSLGERHRLTRAEVVVANAVAGAVARMRRTTREEKSRAARLFYVQLEPLPQTAGEENIVPNLHRHGMRATGRLNSYHLAPSETGSLCLAVTMCRPQARYRRQ
jgi:hypothetical protein